MPTAPTQNRREKTQQKRSIAPAVKGNRWAVPILVCITLGGCEGISTGSTPGPTVLIPEAKQVGLVFTKERWGYRNFNYESIIPPRFDEAYFFKEGLARVVYRGKTGWIDQSGEFVIAPQYKAGRNFNSGLAMVLLDGKWGAIDSDGETVIRIKYDALGYARGVWNYELTRFRLGARWGYVNKQGQEVIPPMYEDASHFDLDTEYAPVQIDGKWGAIDKNGLLVIAPQFDALFDWSEGMAVVEWRRKRLGIVPLVPEFGFVDTDGNVWPQRFQDANYFSEGLAAVAKGGAYFPTLIPVEGAGGEAGEKHCFGIDGLRWGYVNKKGENVIPFQFEEAGSFQEERARVAKDGETFYIDKEGKRIGREH